MIQRVIDSFSQRRGGDFRSLSGFALCEEISGQENGFLSGDPSLGIQGILRGFSFGTLFGMAFDFIKGTDQVQERTRGGITGFFRVKEFSPYMSPASGMFKRQIIIQRNAVLLLPFPGTSSRTVVSSQ